MQRAIPYVADLQHNKPVLIAAAAGLLVGLVIGLFNGSDSESKYLLREIRAAVDSHTCSSWASESEGGEVRRAVIQALVDWQESEGKIP